MRGVCVEGEGCHLVWLGSISYFSLPLKTWPKGGPLLMAYVMLRDHVAQPWVCSHFSCKQHFP